MMNLGVEKKIKAFNVLQLWTALPRVLFIPTNIQPNVPQKNIILLLQEVS